MFKKDLELALNYVEGEYGDGREVVVENCLFDYKNNQVIIQLNDIKLVVDASDVEEIEDFEDDEDFEDLVAKVEDAYCEARNIFMPNCYAIGSEVCNALRKINKYVVVGIVWYDVNNKKLEVEVHNIKGNPKNMLNIYLPAKCDYGAEAVKEFNKAMAEEE